MFNKINLQGYIPQLRSAYAKGQIQFLHNEVDTARKELDAKVEGYHEIRRLFEQEYGTDSAPKIGLVLETHRTSLRLEKLERLRLRPRYRLRRIRDDSRSNRDQATIDEILERYRLRMVVDFDSLEELLSKLEDRTMEAEHNLGKWIVIKLKGAVQALGDEEAQQLLSSAADGSDYQSHA